MAVDLHTHSSFSDGSDSPAELVVKAVDVGLSALALTDHDTVEGVASAREEAEHHPIELIQGVEISCEWPPGTMHLVVLFLDDGSGPLQDGLAELREGRTARNAQIINKLQGLGIDITLEEVQEEAGEGSVGRPHFASIMVRKGVVEDIKTAFDDYLAAGGPAYADRVRLKPADAIDLARRSGAVPILAHPHTLGHDRAGEYAQTLAQLADHGLIGIECLYGEYDADQQADFAQMAARFGLLPSGGSDYHGTYKADVELGVGRGSLQVPDTILTDLRSARDAL